MRTRNAKLAGILAGIFWFAVACGFGQGLFNRINTHGLPEFTNLPGSEPSLPTPGPEAADPTVLARARIDELVDKYASSYGVPKALIHAMIQVESNYNPRAVSHKGAKGLMQLIPATAARFGVQKIFDPEENIHGGVRYLRYLWDTFEGDLKLILAAYNAGENLVQRLNRVPSFPETWNYVRRVNTLYSSSRQSSDARPDFPTQMYKYRDEQGVLHYTNIPPPRNIAEASDN